METESPDTYIERPHPGDVTAAETKLVRRRLLLGLAIAVSLNLAFLTGGAAIANYIIAVFRPYFYPDKIVYVELHDPPSPSPAPSSSPAANFELK